MKSQGIFAAQRTQKSLRQKTEYHAELKHLIRSLAREEMIEHEGPIKPKMLVTTQAQSSRQAGLSQTPE